MQARNFYMLYLTLMLILVSFLVGAFIRKGLKKNDGSGSTVVAKQESSSSKLTIPADTFSLKDVFLNEFEVNQDKLEALATVLNRHDIVAELLVFPPESNKTDDMFEVALGRSATLLRELARRGVGLETVHSLARTQKHSNDIEVRIYHGA